MYRIEILITITKTNINYHLRKYFNLIILLWQKIKALELL